jgi:hypothetical protein
VAATLRRPVSDSDRRLTYISPPTGWRRSKRKGTTRSPRTAEGPAQARINRADLQSFASAGQGPECRQDQKSASQRRYQREYRIRHQTADQNGLPSEARHEPAAQGAEYSDRHREDRAYEPGLWQRQSIMRADCAQERWKDLAIHRIEYVGDAEKNDYRGQGHLVR